MHCGHADMTISHMALTWNECHNSRYRCMTLSPSDKLMTHLSTDIAKFSQITLMKKSIF